MYYYIVDPQKISQRDFERVQNLLYSSLSEYRISGEVARVTGLRSVTQLVENAFARGVKTLVAVGSDDTLTDIINAIRGREVTVGFIPIVKARLGKILGINNLLHGVKSIALRRIAEVDLGLVVTPPKLDPATTFEKEANDAKLGNYFISKLDFGFSPTENIWQNINFKSIQNLFGLQTLEIKFSADGVYQGSLNVTAGMIINAHPQENGEKISDPTDGLLDVLFLPKLTKWQTFLHRKNIFSGHYEKIPQACVLHLKKIQITSPANLSLKTGGRILAKTPATIEILPKALKIIVSNQRNF